MKAQKIVFSNQKGGVGKTTLTRELSIYLASLGNQVCVIDMDPQANVSRSLTDNPATVAELAGCHEALSGESFEVVEVQPNLHLLAGDIKMALLEKALLAEIDAHTRLQELLTHRSFKPFEYIFIDSPPSLGVLTINALTAADHVIIPMNPSLYSMQGTNDLMNTIDKVKKSLNRNISLLGVVINAFDSVPVITRQIKGEIVEAFKGKVFATTLSKSIRIEEAIVRGEGVTSLSKGKVKDEVIEIARELLVRLGVFDEPAPRVRECRYEIRLPRPLTTGVEV